MTLLTMTATFGCLDGATLTLKPGMNLLEAPNEGGKSTWCAFLRAMFYGLESRKGGAFSQRNRYTPWSGAPMAGTVELLWRGQSITLRRFPKGQNPFGGFEAVYTGTRESVPRLTADNVGETLLGCSREVFERTCFIPQGGIQVDKSGDLERRVAALAASGEEDVSFSETQRRLKAWRNARQANRSTGRIPKLKLRLEELELQKSRLLEARDRAQKAQEELEELERQRQAVADDLRRHADLQAADYKRRYDTAQAQLDAAQQAYDQLSAPDLPPLPPRQALLRAQADLAYYRVLAQRQGDAQTQLQEADARLTADRAQAEESPFSPLAGDQAVAQAESLAQTLSAPHRAHFSHWTPLLACAAGTTVFFIVGLATRAIHPAVLLGVGGGVLAAGAFVSFLLSALGRKKEAKSRRETLDRYGVESPQALTALAQSYARRWGSLQEAIQRRQLAQADLEAIAQSRKNQWDALKRFCAPFAPGQDTPEALETALQSALDREGRRERARSDLERAQAVWAAASAGGAPAQLPPDPEPPKWDLTQDKSRLARLEEEIALLAQQRSRAQGEERGLGDLSALSQEQSALAEELERQTRELEALDLALEALDAAQAQLQARFSPQVNRRAGELLHQLTGGRYTALSFTREFQILADQGSGDKPAQFLSQGAADQAYLALRLAISDLTFPGPDLPPLVLDDALVTFDNTRLALALQVLEERGRTQQLLLFTCQDRERRALAI